MNTWPVSENENKASLYGVTNLGMSDYSSLPQGTPFKFELPK